MFIVGIDVAKRSHEATIITSDGEIVQSAFSFRNNCSGYNALLERVRKLTNQRNQIVFAMESTAHYWLALYAQLTKDGYRVLVLNPIQPHALRDLYIRPLKTDARDSLIIADVVRFGRCKPSSIPQDKLLALRELCRSRSYLMGMASDLKRKLIALLDQVFPEYETLFDSLFCRSSVAALHRYPTPEKLKYAHVEKLSELLRQHSGGHFGEWKARQLKDAAVSSFGIDDCCGVYSTLIATFLRQIEELTREVNTLRVRGQAAGLRGDGSIGSAVRRVHRHAEPNEQARLALSPPRHLDGDEHRRPFRPNVPRLLREEIVRGPAPHERCRSRHAQDDGGDLRGAAGREAIPADAALRQLKRVFSVPPTEVGLVFRALLCPLPCIEWTYLSLDKPIADC